jgi:hypothetical protein
MGIGTWRGRWLSREVDELLRPVAKEVRSKRGVRQLAAPTRRSGAITVVCILALIPITRLLANYWPGDGLNLVSGPELDSGYSTLWQVQAGIAAVALPLLIFVIERSRDTPEAASTSAEVLILNSYALPTIAFALAVTFNIGVNLANGETATTFAIDLALFGATCLLTLVAYYRVIRLLFTPHELRAQSRQLQRERAIESSLDSLRSRASLRLLGVAMREVGLRFDPGGPAPRSGRLLLTSNRGGVLRDMDLDKLKRFVDELPWQDPGKTGSSRPAAVWLGIFPNQRVDLGDTLFAIEQGNFLPIDQAAQEKLANRVFRIG